jgi:cell division septation protein DedD
MSNRGRSAVLGRVTGAAVTIALMACLLPTLASAATPASNATCTGSLAPDSSGGDFEPNLLDYAFSCDTDITNYTFVVSRSGQANAIDDFEPSPAVIQSSDGQPSGTQTFTCQGDTPGNGFNCNAPTGTPMTAGNSAQGSLDPVDPYCKRLPPGAKPGTPAEPQAQVSVIVQDATGATDGPFTLDITPACPAVPNTVPYPPPPKVKPTTRCWGHLAKGQSPTAKQPNLVDYRFLCNGKVTAYSLVVERYPHGTKNVNAFAANPLVYLPGGAPSTAESFGCTGAVPSDGFNCLAPAQHEMWGGHTVRGTFSPVDPYCKRLPPGGKPGASAEPQAVVKLVITDATGAQRGPFTMVMKPSCPAVPDRVPSTTHSRRSVRQTQSRQARS